MTRGVRRTPLHPLRAANRLGATLSTLLFAIAPAAPAWLYIAARGLHSIAPRAARIQRTVGRSAEVAAVALCCASALTEVSQYYWPRGLFSGRFDPADIAAYALALAAGYAAERRWPVGPARVAER